jgi:uncharacterized protein
MKYIVLIAVILLVIWMMRGPRRDASRGAPERRAGPPPPQDMVECPVCHVHLPRADALAGPAGQLYCCAEHSRSAGG